MSNGCSARSVIACSISTAFNFHRLSVGDRRQSQIAKLRWTWSTLQDFDVPCTNYVYSGLPRSIQVCASPRVIRYRAQLYGVNALSSPSSIALNASASSAGRPISAMA